MCFQVKSFTSHAEPAVQRKYDKVLVELNFEFVGRSFSRPNIHIYIHMNIHLYMYVVYICGNWI